MAALNERSIMLAPYLEISKKRETMRLRLCGRILAFLSRDLWKNPHRRDRDHAEGQSGIARACVPKSRLERISRYGRDCDDDRKDRLNARRHDLGLSI